VLLLVGYGALVKGFDIALRIFDALRTEFRLKLIVAGTIPHNATYYPEISEGTVQRADLLAFEQRLRSDASIDFRPRRRGEMRSIYGRADVNLHLSRLETFGYSILEAMSHGVPVVGTRLNAIPEMVEHERTGYLCDPSDADVNSIAWRERIFDQGLEYTRRLLGDPALRERMGRAARERVAHAFNIDFKRNRLAGAYRDAISQRTPLLHDQSGLSRAHDFVGRNALERT
jgi:glycosyltransferase involved in cell wall biosynthesis